MLMVTGRPPAIWAGIWTTDGIAVCACADWRPTANKATMHTVNTKRMGFIVKSPSKQSDCVSRAELIYLRQILDIPILLSFPRSQVAVKQVQAQKNRNVSKLS